MRKLKIMMTFVAVALIISLAAGGTLAWIEVYHPFSQQKQEPSVSTPVASSEEILPVYDNDFNLLLVNHGSPLPADYQPQLETFQNHQFDSRILPALKKMLQQAEKDEIRVAVTGGYVSAQEQDKQYQQEVQRLISQEGYTQVRAEDKVQNTIGRGGYNEKQTGMSVVFASQDEPSLPFAQTKVYQWLVKNGVNYGFVLRFPENKTKLTGAAFVPAQFRYVGVENAQRMREYSMCLEEYAPYVARQS